MMGSQNRFDNPTHRVTRSASLCVSRRISPTFGKEILRLTQSDALLVTLCVGLSNLFWLPIMGAVSDRIGRRPVLIALAATAVLTAYPAMAWLAVAPSFSKLLIVELWFSFMYAGYNGAMVVYLTEIVPVAVRT